jgi:hypothetical protein
MKGTTFFLLILIFLQFVLITSAFENTPLPTPAIPLQREHYVYNHIVPVGVYEHEDICVSVFVDQIREGDEARIQFRTRAGDAFHMMPLGYNPSEQRFMVCIDERFHVNSAIEYYIELFPYGMAPIRIPENPGEFHQIKVKKKFSKYLEPILIGLLIVSPAFAAFLYSKIRKVHSKRKAEYENRLRARRRKLHKEREKHYKEYLKTLSGRKSPAPQTPAQSPVTPPPESSRKTAPPKPGKPDMNDTDKELRRELDSILNVIPVSSPSEQGNGLSSRDKPQNRHKTPPSKRHSKNALIDDSDGLSEEDKKKLMDLFEE